MKRFLTTKKLLLSIIILVIVAASCLLVVFLACRDSNPAVTQEEGKASSTTKKNGYKIPSWEEIRNLPEPRLGFNPSSSYVNKPVNGELKVEIDPEDIEQLPETINVYELVPMFQSEDEFIQMAERFDIHGEVSDDSNIREGDRRLAYDPNLDGSYFYDKKEAESQVVADVPSEDECKKIAWNIAEEKGLLPPEAEIIATNQTNRAVEETDNALVTHRRTIVIGRSIDGYDVRGPGMQMRIMLGNKGKLCSIDDNIRDLKLYGTYKVKPLEQALDEARQGLGTMNLTEDAIDPTVKNVSIFYYAEPSSLENRALLPVYAFMSGDCCIYVPAFGEPISQ